MIDLEKEREEIDNRVSEEIEQFLASFQKEHYLSNEEYEKLSFIVDKSYWLGEFRKQAEIDELKAKLEKAQAVPEGFVVVPKKMSESFDEALYAYSNNISVVNEHSDGFIPMSDINHSEIWGLVIEAAQGEEE